MLVKTKLRNYGSYHTLPCRLAIVGSFGLGVPFRIAHATQFHVGFGLVILVMPGANASTGRAGSGVGLREVILPPVVQLQSIAFGKLSGFAFCALGLATEQPPRGVKPGCAGSEY